MIVGLPSGPRSEFITHSLAEKNRPRKTGRPSNEKTNGPIQKSLLTRSQKKNRPAKTKRPSAQALEGPEPSISYVLGHQYRFYGNRRAVFSWVGLPAGPRPEIITHSLAEKNRPGKTGRPSNKKQMPLLFFHYSLRTANRQSNSCSLTFACSEALPEEQPGGAPNR